MLPRAPVLAAALIGGAGCNAVYAPPLRTAHAGAPGHLQPGNVEVGLATSGEFYVPVGMLSGTAGYRVRKNLIVTGGVDGRFSAFALGWGGVAVPGTLRLSRNWSLSADGEIGVGAGAGGTKSCGDRTDCTNDGLRWYRRPAGGAYLGAGGAVRWGPVSLYSRARAQVAGAKGVPATSWSSVFGGLHFHIVRRADLWAGAAFVHYANGMDANSGYVTELGLSFQFDPYLGWRR